MQSNPHKLTVIDGETLMDKRLPPTKFCVDTLLPQGLCILGGSPKVGKSWLVLDLCVHVAQGTPLWGLDVTRGEVLYLCLEDSERRIQERLNTITDNVPEGMYFAMGCTEVNPKGLKQMMNRYRYQLEDLGVFFESKRSDGQKYVVVKYRPPSDGASSASSDSVSSALTDSVPFVPCVPAGDVG